MANALSPDPATTRPDPLTFLVYHHEAHGPFSVPQLLAGDARYGGSVARLRLLFHLAKRGHRVILVGNVTPSHAGGIHGHQASHLSHFSGLAALTRAVVIFNNFPSEEHWAGLLEAKHAGLRYVVWAGNDIPTRWFPRVERKEIDRVVCVSHTARDDYRLYKFFPQVEASYSGVDKDFLPTLRQPEPGVVLSLSVPRRSKGFDNLLRAWPLVRRQHPASVLRVTGAASMHDPKAPLGASGILDRDLEEEFPGIFRGGRDSMAEAGVELLGARPLPEVYDALSRASVAVVNTGHGSVETYCRAAVEAQICGVPVVGGWAGALPEVIANGRTGILCRSPAPEEIASAILKLLDNPALRASMAKSGPLWANWLADYDCIAPDWEGIAERAWSGDEAPAQPRPWEDRLRHLGYGAVRLRLQAGLPKPMLNLARTLRSQLS